MKTNLLKEIDRLYEVEKCYRNLLNDLSYIISHKEGHKPFNEFYDTVITKYFFLPKDFHKEG